MLFLPPFEYRSGHRGNKKTGGKNCRKGGHAEAIPGLRVSPGLGPQIHDQRDADQGRADVENVLSATLLLPTLYSHLLRQERFRSLSAATARRVLGSHITLCPRVAQRESIIIGTRRVEPCSPSLHVRPKVERSLRSTRQMHFYFDSAAFIFFTTGSMSALILYNFAVRSLEFCQYNGSPNLLIVCWNPLSSMTFLNSASRVSIRS